MDGKEIEDFYGTHQALYSFLIEKGEPSFASEASNNFRRSLVLAVASYFEAIITSIVREIPRRHANAHPFLCGLIDTKVIPRQYHTYFDWDKNNANTFFKLFGSEFATKAAGDVRNSNDLNQSVRDFLELGATRNRLVHINYVTYDVDKTPDDIIRLFRSAMGFIAYIRAELLGKDEKDDGSGTGVIVGAAPE